MTQQVNACRPHRTRYPLLGALAGMLALGLGAPAWAARPARATHSARLVVLAPLKGSRAVLVHQNRMADDEGLQRVRDASELDRLRTQRLLVDIPESASLWITPELGADRRCARVWTARFAADMATAFHARFHEPLRLNSAVRTIAFQERLQHTNGNAAGIDGEAASPHLTGQAIDFGKHGMTAQQIAWMRAYLKPLMDAGKVDVEEEFQQACFHISVYKSYLPVVNRATPDVAQARHTRRPLKSLAE